VKSYLGDFLFSPARANSPVSSLSGGERARLLLARLFARPANVLVLDEPTNDLDIETLELLEELLQEYSGTVLLVSHDRIFLNNVITQTIAYEGNGQWRDYVGGYDDWLAQRPKAQAPESTVLADHVTLAESRTPPPPPAPAEKAKGTKAGKLGNWEQKELDALPDQIAAIEARQAELSSSLADGLLYRDDPNQVAQINAKLEALQKDLDVKFERWEALESKRLGGA
jgi:ATP-binding cassette subfamily F protein uup